MVKKFTLPKPTPQVGVVTVNNKRTTRHQPYCTTCRPEWRGRAGTKKSAEHQAVEHAMTEHGWAPSTR